MHHNLCHRTTQFFRGKTGIVSIFSHPRTLPVGCPFSCCCCCCIIIDARKGFVTPVAWTDSIDAEPEPVVDWSEGTGGACEAARLRANGFVPVWADRSGCWIVGDVAYGEEVTGPVGYDVSGLVPIAGVALANGLVDFWGVCGEASDVGEAPVIIIDCRKGLVSCDMGIDKDDEDVC